MPSRLVPVALALALAGFAVPAASVPASHDPKSVPSQGESATGGRPQDHRATSIDAERRRADAAIEAAVGKGDWRAALAVVDAFLTNYPDDALMLYNAACAKAQLGDLDGAFDAMRRSLDAGFGDLGTALGDPDIASLRDDPRWGEIRDRLRRKLPASERRARDGEQAFDAWKKKYGDRRYTYESDEARRLLLALALDETSRTQMLEMLHRQGDWTARELFGGVQNDPVLLAIPHPVDFKDFFPDANTAGVYEHRNRRLVSRDTGASLRHEFVHLLHWGHMDRLRQVHPIWVQEGLASLFEDYAWEEDGAPRFRPNIRHNLARGAAMHGNAPPWPRFFTLNGPQFMEKAELNYALARSIFEFLADRGKLLVWYRAYTEGFEGDPTGVKSMERAFDRPIADVEKEWRRWVAGRGAIKDHNSIDPIILGIEATNANDGVKVTRVHRRTPAAHAGLRIGDVIVSVNSETVRSLEELVMALGRRARGEPIEVGYRRRGEYRTATLVQSGERPALAP